jgi:hypothetical protein
MLVSILLGTLLLAPSVAQAQAAAATPPIAPAFEQDIKRLLDVTNAQRLSEQMSNAFMTQFSQALKASNPNIPPRAMEIATEVARSFFTQRYPALIPKMVVAYAKVLTPEDVRQLLAFYETPLGKRLIEITPALAQAGAAAGQQWGQEMIPELTAEMQRRFKAEGLIP